ncbi:putative apoptosis-inducing factor 1, mitochondrial isoform X1 [Drosophila pseudoobscura]|uniref:Apoptosis-inducing factor 1, mitochondrial isoform X1 n=1 Tax=Drosophila pseudoobscura pseudoobscura TaxID=46245 RepID=A0A6I8V9K1_DROPS|nr:putative apoptosis-inducing factor 1, mitochondrial isoform X1 [Drosophila pseudoobscura]
MMSLWTAPSVMYSAIRRAHILARKRTIVQPSSQHAAPVFDLQRSCHGKLYEMVKKRSLDARTKAHAQKNPNQKVCVRTDMEEEVEYDTDVIDRPKPPPPRQFQAKYQDYSQAADHKFPGAPANSSKYMPTAKQVFFKSVKYDTSTAGTLLDWQKQSDMDKHMSKDPCRLMTKEPGKQPPEDPCEQFKRMRLKNDPKQCPPSGSAAPDGGDGCNGKDSGDPNQSLKLKCLLGALAAMVAGGLIAWFLASTKNDDNKGAGGGSDGDNNSADAKRGVSGLVTSPDSSEKLPKHVPYLIIGGGTAAFSAFRSIKSNDAKAKVLIVSNEYHKPYMRPPLSKELWYTPNTNEKTIKDYRFKQWAGSERSLFFEPDEFFVDPEKLEESVNGGIAVAQGFSVQKVDAQNHTVTLNDGYKITYDECLIATGCAPKNLPMFRDAAPSVREKVMVYRTPDDFDRLRRYAAEKRSITIVGNGFIGSELACSLAHYSKENDGGKIYQVFQESGNMSKVLPNYLSRWTMAKMKNQGVCVIPNASIKSATRDEESLKLELNNGMTLLSDIVVVCVGCSPNTNLASPSKLEVDRTLGGFVVNAELEARRNLYVAGDASCFYDPLLGRRRVEHHDHSVVSGKLAGENMTGAKKPYVHQSMFWSDLGPEIGYEGIGLADSSLPTVGIFALPSATDARSSTDNLTVNREEDDGSKHTIIVDEKSNSDVVTWDDDAHGEQPDYGRGVIFYLKNEKIVGVLMWNLFSRVGLARTIINQNKKYDDLNEVAKLFEIHS